MKLKLPANAAHLSPIIAIGACGLFAAETYGLSIFLGSFEHSFSPLERFWPLEWGYIMQWWILASIIVPCAASSGIGIYLAFRATRQKPWTILSGIIGSLANIAFLLAVAFFLLIYIHLILGRL